MKGVRITQIQRGCVYDGPGVRTTVFLKGCSIECPWCCNPETISPNEEYFIDINKCLLNSSIHSKLCGKCEQNRGSQSILECPFGVCEAVFKDLSCNELFNHLSKDFSLMKLSNGGVTFSGGEPLLQIEELEPLLKDLKHNEVSIAFETTLTTSTNSIVKALSYSNIFIVDLKLQPEHPLGMNLKYRESLKEKLYFIKSKHIEIIYRLVYMDSLYYIVEDILSFLVSLGIKKIELIKCHNLGRSKYLKLGKINREFPSSDYYYNLFSRDLVSRDIEVVNLSY